VPEEKNVFPVYLAFNGVQSIHELQSFNEHGGSVYIKSMCGIKSFHWLKEPDIKNSNNIHEEFDNRCKEVDTCTLTRESYRLGIVVREPVIAIVQLGFETKKTFYLKTTTAFILDNINGYVIRNNFEKLEASTPGISKYVFVLKRVRVKKYGKWLPNQLISEKYLYTPMTTRLKVDYFEQNWLNATAVPRFIMDVEIQLLGDTAIINIYPETFVSMLTKLGGLLGLLMGLAVLIRAYNLASFKRKEEFLDFREVSKCMETISLMHTRSSSRKAGHGDVNFIPGLLLIPSSNSEE